MVFFNYSTMQMAAKIVFYGPGLCGKTTNLQYIYKKTAPKSRGEMVCLETETDRTLFFDLLPIDVGVIGGFKTRFQLYTVPGQVFYNSTRKLVLRGVDGIVFVADSQIPAEDNNIESLMNLKENLLEHNLDIDTIPLVFQFNKRDLTNIMPIEKLNRILNPSGLPFYEAAAVQGVGVFETLKGISKATLFSLRRKALGDESVSRPAVAAAAPAATQKEEVKASEEKTLVGKVEAASVAPASHRQPTPQTPAPLPLPPPPVAAEQAQPSPVIEAPALKRAILEEKVEFAERHVQVAALSQEKIEMKKIAVKSSGDIGRQLDALREQYTLSKGSEKASEKPVHKAAAGPSLEDLLERTRIVAVPQDLKRKSMIAIPSALVKAGPTTLVLTIRNSSSGKSETIEIPLDIDKSKSRVALHLDVDINIT